MKRVDSGYWERVFKDHALKREEEHAPEPKPWIRITEPKPLAAKETKK